MSDRTSAPPLPPSSDRPVLTVAEAAALLGVNSKTLYAEISAGRFPAIRLGRVIRISRTVVNAILEQGRVPTAGPKASAPTRATARRF